MVGWGNSAGVLYCINGAVASGVSIASCFEFENDFHLDISVFFAYN